VLTDQGQLDTSMRGEFPSFLQVLYRKIELNLQTRFLFTPPTRPSGEGPWRLKRKKGVKVSRERERCVSRCKRGLLAKPLGRKDIQPVEKKKGSAPCYLRRGNGWGVRRKTHLGARKERARGRSERPGLRGLEPTRTA